MIVAAVVKPPRVDPADDLARVAMLFGEPAALGAVFAGPVAVAVHSQAHGAHVILI